VIRVGARRTPPPSPRCSMRSWDQSPEAGASISDRCRPRRRAQEALNGRRRCPK
jgi:hypothetical protein